MKQTLKLESGILDKLEKTLAKNEKKRDEVFNTQETENGASEYL